MNAITQAKDLALNLRGAFYDFDVVESRAVFERLVAEDALCRLGFPFETTEGSGAFFDKAFGSLAHAFPDLERRVWVEMVGPDPDGAVWIGCGGTYVGTFASPWLDIPATGHLAHMRFHEFFRVEDERIVEIQALWDIPELMMQAGAWPMAPSLGRDWCVPGPATQDGLRTVRDAEESAAAETVVVEMLRHMSRHPSQGGPEVMEMECFWHPHMSWYGPAGIGTARGISGFRNWHQIPFLAAMPDRGQYPEEVKHHFFADGPYVGVTGWPNMAQTLSFGGFRDIGAMGRKVTLRSLDFWRLEQGLIRENWVMVDLLSLYDQVGVDVLGRMREFNKARAGFDPETGRTL